MVAKTKLNHKLLNLSVNHIRRVGIATEKETMKKCGSIINSHIITQATAFSLR